MIPRLSKWFSLPMVVLAGAGGALAGESKKDTDAPAMTLTSPAFADGAAIPTRHTRAGEGVSPPLAWTNPPPGTRSFLLHVHDVDTPQELYKSSPTRLHWLVWNIPATANGIAEGMGSGSPGPAGSLQISAVGPGYLAPGADQNDGGSKAAFRQMRPPPDVHRYRFEIWALDMKLDVQPEADAVKTRDKVLLAMNGHVLGRAVYTGTFQTPAD